MNANLRATLQQIEAEKSIRRDTLIEAIRSALESAARKSLSHAANVTVEVDTETLTFKVFEIREVVEAVEDDSLEIALDTAQGLNPEAQVGDRLKVPTEPRDFGRIAAQTAKQVIIQKIKDAERENIYEEFKKREGELVTGVVKRVSHGNVIVAVDRAEAILPQREQSPRENFKPNDRIRAYLREVERNARGPQVVLSRTSTELVRSLFALEVPEIYDGTIEIKGIAREPGSRTKIAVISNDGNVDAVGACVGMKGSRVRAVVEELCGEKIDIVRWSEDPVELCGNALNPADILDITVDEETRVVLVIVPHDQLSLAIGKRGQNARLASKLMGWNIDIKSDLELTEASPEGAAGGPSDAQAVPDAEMAGEDAESAGEDAESADDASADEAEVSVPDAGDGAESADDASAGEAEVPAPDAGEGADVAADPESEKQDTEEDGKQEED